MGDPRHMSLHQMPSVQQAHQQATLQALAQGHYPSGHGSIPAHLLPPGAHHDDDDDDHNVDHDDDDDDDHNVDDDDVDDESNYEGQHVLMSVSLQS